MDGQDDIPKPLSPLESSEKPQYVLSAPLKKTTPLWKWIGILSTIICILSILCIALIGIGVNKIRIESAPIETLIDKFMEDMRQKNIQEAYANFSPRAQKQTPESKIKEMVEGNNYILFEGYQSIEIQNINLQRTANTNPEYPQGTVANVMGVVFYTGGFEGQFTAVLEKVDGSWKLYFINITVPPDKFVH